jgi:hypothetical protein
MQEHAVAPAVTVGRLPYIQKSSPFDISDSNRTIALPTAAHDIESCLVLLLKSQQLLLHERRIRIIRADYWRRKWRESHATDSIALIESNRLERLTRRQGSRAKRLCACASWQVTGKSSYGDEWNRANAHLD